MKYLNSKYELVDLDSFDMIGISNISKDEGDDEGDKKRMAVIGTKYTSNSETVKVIIDGLFDKEDVIISFYSHFLASIRRGLQFFTYNDIKESMITPKEEMEEIEKEVKKIEDTES